MRALLLARLAAGCIFLSEGIQKFLFPAELGVGRFAKIGLPAPQLLAPFVGVVEIVCGALLMTRNPPRDVMLSHAGKEMGGYGWAFGLHEGLDQLGALLGPLAMAGILALRHQF